MVGLLSKFCSGSFALQRFLTKGKTVICDALQRVGGEQERERERERDYVRT